MHRYYNRNYKPKPKPPIRFVIDSMKSASSVTSGQPTKSGDVPSTESPGMWMADRMLPLGSVRDRNLREALRVTPKPPPPRVDLSLLAPVALRKGALDARTPVATGTSAPIVGEMSLDPPSPTPEIPATAVAVAATGSRKRSARVIDDTEEEEKEEASDPKYTCLRQEVDGVKEQLVRILNRLEGVPLPAAPVIDFTCFVKTISLAAIAEGMGESVSILHVGFTNTKDMGFHTTTAYLPRPLVAMLVLSLGVKYGEYGNDANESWVYVQTALINALMDVKSITCLMLMKVLPREFARFSLRAKFDTIFDICYRTVRFEGPRVATRLKYKLFAAHVIELTNFWIQYADSFAARDSNLSNTRYFRLDLALDHFITKFVHEYDPMACLAGDTRRCVCLTLK